jgi:hypothetical protein
LQERQNYTDLDVVSAMRTYCKYLDNILFYWWGESGSTVAQVNEMIVTMRQLWHQNWPAERKISDITTMGWTKHHIEELCEEMRRVVRLTAQEKKAQLDRKKQIIKDATAQGQPAGDETPSAEVSQEAPSLPTNTYQPDPTVPSMGDVAMVDAQDTQVEKPKEQEKWPSWLSQTELNADDMHVVVPFMDDRTLYKKKAERPPPEPRHQSNRDALWGRGSNSSWYSSSSSYNHNAGRNSSWGQHYSSGSQRQSMENLNARRQAEKDGEKYQDAEAPTKDAPWRSRK